MTQLELPHVNVLSKMDLIEQYGALEFGLEFYTDVLDLSYLLPRLKQTNNASHPLGRKFARLHAAIADLIESYNLVSFVPLDVQNQELLTQVLKVVDKANGYMYVQESSAATGQGAAASTTAGMQQRNLLTTVDQSQLHDLHLSVSQPPRTRTRIIMTNRLVASGACGVADAFHASLFGSALPSLSAPLAARQSRHPGALHAAHHARARAAHQTQSSRLTGIGRRRPAWTGTRRLAPVPFFRSPSLLPLCSPLSFPRFESLHTLLSRHC